MSTTLCLTEDARLECEHAARLANEPSQDLVFVDGKRLLVAKDPEGRHINLCPNLSPITKPCITSLAVVTGYSAFVAIDGHAVCLATIVGFTDGTPPGTRYLVRETGQDWVGASE